MTETKFCPNCHKKVAATSKSCLYCKSIFYEEEKPVKFNFDGMQAPGTQAPNPNLIQCPACGNMMSKNADICPACGNPRQKKVANPGVLDALAIIAIVIAIFGYMGGAWMMSYGILLVLMIIYWGYYSSIKDNPDIDASKVKQSLNVITILFILMFCIGFVIIF